MPSCFELCAIYRHHGIMGDQAYFRSAIAHFRGFHGAGCSCETLEDKRLRALDPVGSSLREWAITTECPPMDDIVDPGHYEKLFVDACRGSLTDVQIELRVLKERSLPIPLQPLATVAADRGFPDILRFCLDQGAVFDADLDMAALYAAKTPGMLDVLMAHNWRNISFSESARRETGCAPGAKSPQRPPMPEAPPVTRPLSPEQIKVFFGDIRW